MIGTLTDPRIVAAIGESCGAAAHDARRRMDRALRREVTKQSAAREEGFTDNLADAIDAVGDGLVEYLAAASHDLAANGSNVRIEFATEKAPQGEERDFGLDLGIRVIIETPGYTSQKAILVQCKRMYGSGSAARFPKLHGDGEEQAEKMLRVSPSSFFFLFNGGPDHELFEMLRLAPFVVPWDLYAPHLSRHGPYFDPGVTVIPATRVLAMSRAAAAAGTSMPTGARDVLAGSLPLGHFVASLFAPCFVGDVRTPILRLATPPTLRESVSGLEAEVPELSHLRAQRFFTLKVRKESAPP